ncbi:MAG: hypothetical protein GX552_02855 [Chloroflexi bacterium]|nr:hypothetical protein [Chloroflexota bacterium]
MEDTIDLGKYLDTLIRRWRLVVLPALAFAVIAGSLVFTKPQKHEASVQVALVSETTSVSFDTAITTTSDRDLIQAQNRERRAVSLVNLVRNPNIARAVLTRLGSQLPADLQSVPRLLSIVQASLIQGSDPIEIKVIHSDPKLAILIANAWGVEYEQSVNQLYGGSSQETQATILQQTRRAKADYDDAQAALVAFIGENRIDELQLAIAEKQQIISTLQQGKQTALSTIIEQEMAAQKEIAAAYMNAQASNILLAFRQEQEAKRRLWEAYTNADLQARLLVFNEQTQARLSELSHAYVSKANLERVLADARALQTQLTESGNAGLTTNALALLLLKEQAYASSSNLGNLQVQLDDLNSLQTTSREQAADLQAFITTLEARIAELDQEIATKSEGLLDNTGYELPDLARDANDPLMTAIQAGYLELFTLDSLANLSGEVAINNPLAAAGMEKAKELLQLQGLENLPAYLEEARPLNETLDQLQNEVRLLQAELTQEQSKREELTKTREIAWQTYTTMSEKSAEVNIGSSLASSVVRLATTTSYALPQDRELLQQVVIAGVLGMILGIVAAFVIEYYQGYRARTASDKAADVAPEGTPL